MQSYAQAIKLYDKGYSLRRLRERCLLQRLYTQHHDLWLSVKVVFNSLAHGEERLALPALGGLFDESQCPDLMADEVNLTNDDLLRAFKLMRWANLQGVFTLIDYRNIDTRDIGSLYEGLLELVPTITFLDPTDRFTFSFAFAQGNANERKSSGSYYTPDALVKSLITTALDPVIEQKLAEHPEDPEAALLSLKVIDPACGSGHFLLAAAHRITARIMEQKAFIVGAEEAAYRKTMHEVVANCIYGVDINPMAIELARLSLWLEAASVNLPLSFIDHHLKVGNSLLGIMSLECLHLGIPADAYKPQAPIGKGEHALTLSDKVVCSALKKRNTKERKIFADNQLDTGLGDLSNLAAVMAHWGYRNLDQLSADTLQAEARKAQQNEQNQKAIENTPEYQACNLLIAAFLSEKTQLTAHLVPTTKDIDLLLSDPKGYVASHKELIKHANAVCQANQVLHWPLAFINVMAQGGFDCVIGNPPWDKPHVEDSKWFAPCVPEIACAKTAAERAKLISLLAQGQLAATVQLQQRYSQEPEVQARYERELFQSYVGAHFSSQMATAYQHLSAEDGGRFPLTGVGLTNLYAYFAELGLRALKPSGCMGMVLPAGILTDDTTKLFSREVFSKGLVQSVYHFNNSEGLFAAVAGNYSFLLLSVHASGDGTPADCVFYATNPSQLADEKRHLSFKSSDLALLNPNTQTALLVRSEYDLELCRKIYQTAPVLIKEGGVAGAPEDPWGAQILQMFNMATASSNFIELNQEQLSQVQERGLVPLYEGKLFAQFDHRFASFGYDQQGKLVDAKSVELSEKQNSTFTVTPRYWVDYSLVQSRLQQKAWTQGWTLAWRNIARSTDERTVMASVLPSTVGCGDTVMMLMPQVDDKHAACLLALLNSLVVDYVERIKQAGVHASIFYVKQLPVLPPEAFAPEDVVFIAARVAQLTRTADDINAVWLIEYPAYTFQEPRERLQIRAELDAYIAKMYGLTREELQYILDPAEVMGPEHPSVTFPGLKRKETELYGEYLTQRLVLKAFDELTAGTLK